MQAREKEITRTRKKMCVSYFSMRNPYMKLKTLACTVRKIWNASDFIPIFSKVHNSRKGDNLHKKKYVCQLFFHEELI